MENKCGACTKNRTPSSVPYSVYEMREQGNRKTITKLWVLIIILIITVIGSNIAWLVYESQYETLNYSYSQDGQGTNIMGNHNEVTNNGSDA